MKSSEELLVKQLQIGDKIAFNRLFDEYAGRLYSFAMKHLRSSEDAGELVQNVFYKIWRNHERLDESKSFKAYIFTIAFNEIRKCINRRTMLCELAETVAGDDSTQHEIAYRSALYEVETMLQNLSPRKRQIFGMSRFEELSSKEIALQLGISSKTVDNQVSQVMHYLRKAAGKEYT